MPLNQDLVGKAYPFRGVYEVGREKIREFAAAIGDAHPAYTDPEAARALGYPDVVAPPTFLTVLGFRFAADGPVADPALGLDYSRVVHGEQRFVHHRPIHAGDRLTAVSRVDRIRAAGRHEMLTLATDVSGEAGEPVATLYSTIVSRDTAAPA